MKRVVLILLTAFCAAFPAEAQKHCLKFKNFKAISAWFGNPDDGRKIISGHRGTHIAGYPENAIEGFEYVLNHTPAFFEIDPRLTKDSVIVLLHDATLDRTTNGTGKLADYTWEEVKKLRLKDAEGNLTSYRIPTLQEAMDWAKGRTVLNLDKKDVPMPMITDIIRKNKADNYMMVTVHTAEQALFYYLDNPNRMMSAFVKTEEALKEYEAAGVPWKNIIAYIGSENKPENKQMYDLLHARGVRCMISAAPKYDKLKTREERAESYRAIFRDGADILESDLPVEVAEAMWR